MPVSQRSDSRLKFVAQTNNQRPSHAECSAVALLIVTLFQEATVKPKLPLSSYRAPACLAAVVLVLCCTYVLACPRNGAWGPTRKDEHGNLMTCYCDPQLTADCDKYTPKEVKAKCGSNNMKVTATGVYCPEPLDEKKWYSENTGEPAMCWTEITCSYNEIEKRCKQVDAVDYHPRPISTTANCPEGTGR